jgi:hypothetical protein
MACGLPFTPRARATVANPGQAGALARPFVAVLSGRRRAIAHDRAQRSHGLRAFDLDFDAAGVEPQSDKRFRPARLFEKQ